MRRQVYSLTLMLKACFVIKSGKNDKLGENVAVASMFLCFNAGYPSEKLLNTQLGPFNVHHVHRRVWIFLLIAYNSVLLFSRKCFLYIVCWF